MYSATAIEAWKRDLEELRSNSRPVFNSRNLNIFRGTLVDSIDRYLDSRNKREQSVEFGKNLVVGALMRVSQN